MASGAAGTGLINVPSTLRQSEERFGARRSVPGNRRAFDREPPTTFLPWNRAALRSPSRPSPRRSGVSVSLLHANAVLAARIAIARREFLPS